MLKKKITTKEIWVNIFKLFLFIYLVFMSINFFYKEINNEHKNATVIYIRNEYKDNSSKGLDKYTTVVSVTFKHGYGVEQVNGVRLKGNTFFHEGDKISILWDRKNKKVTQVRPYFDNIMYSIMLAFCFNELITTFKFLKNYCINLE
ncbi:hypothetical protein ACJQWY_01475 [Weissella kandleri]|uniref:hypothetical protein n=1 Tax=Weissella kandleri TaxID=1616 RepID=UPI00387E96A3